MSKKQPAAGSPAAIQKSIHERFQTDKEKNKDRDKDRDKDKGMEAKMELLLQSLQNIEAKQDSLGAIQDAMRLKQEEMGKKQDEMGKKQDEIGARVEMIEKRTEKTDGKVEDLQKMMKEYETEIKEIKQAMADMDVKTEEIEERLNAVEKDNSGLAWEIDHAGFFLRFQNVEEDKDENLVEIMANILAEALEITIDKMKEGIDQAFRVFTRYATKNKLPREIHIRFTKKSIKEQILQVVRNKTLKYRMKEILVLKQIPKKVRDIRREYRGLTKELLKREINYRWLFPEGLTFIFQGQRHRITSVSRAELFIAEYFRGSGEATSGDQQIIQTQAEDLSPLNEQDQGAVGGLPREQREVRTTRAINPSYKT